MDLCQLSNGVNSESAVHECTWLTIQGFLFNSYGEGLIYRAKPMNLSPVSI